ncbi:hypothetical protein G7Z17_g6446 [Cylindrodendrum hubeiense]|uniref:Ankyrin n=1 Tax=Cylindrodendrum hubeiense TaxID=595255 RepID=A0A9P5HF72_9HYPO|nr:hypothetical protein G7Z17_g6446 [Cylindrodendrum hubeiense]
MSHSVELWTPLGRAVVNGSIELIEYLIESGANVDEHTRHGINKDGTTALAVAAECGRIDAVRVLLERVAKVSFHSAKLKKIKAKSPEIYQLLLEKAEVDQVQSCLLVDAAEGGKETLATFLGDRNIVETEVLERGLCDAVMNGYVRASRTLLSRGVDPNARKYRMMQQVVNHIAQSNDEPNNNASDDKSSDNMSDDHSDGDASENESDESASESESDDESAEDELDERRFDETNLLLETLKQIWEQEDYESYEDSDAKCIAYLLVKFGARFSIKVLKRNRIHVDFDFCHILANAGCQPPRTQKRGRTALQAAARGGNLTLVQYLLDRGADVNLPAHKKRGRTALQAAAESGHLGTVDCLLDAGADITAPPAKKGGRTLLEAAAKGDPTIIFKKLLTLGAPVNRLNDADGCVLHNLIRGRDMDSLKLALRAGARIEDRFVEDIGGYVMEAMTPLQVAARRLNEEAIHLLLHYRADVNAPAAADGGRTALQHALSPTSSNFEFKTQLNIVKLLLDNQAEINAPASPSFGRTALQAASSDELSNPDLVKLLLENGAIADDEPANEGGITALQGAAIRGELRIARMLLDHGAKVNAPASPEKGRTAIEGAAEHGRLEMVRLLLQRGAKPDLVKGFSGAITMAEKEGHWGIADLLKEIEDTSEPLPPPFSSSSAWALDFA